MSTLKDVAKWMRLKHERVEERTTNHAGVDVVIRLQRFNQSGDVLRLQIGDQIGVKRGPHDAMRRTGERASHVIRHAQPFQGVDYGEHGIQDVVALHGDLFSR